jgi:plasmid stability protein
MGLPRPEPLLGEGAGGAGVKGAIGHWCLFRLGTAVLQFAGSERNRYHDIEHEESDMALLVVRNLPNEVKARLKRRAKMPGRSLEAEVREILAEMPEPAAPPQGEENWVAGLCRRMRELGITNEDIDALNESIAELRRDWRLRDLDFDKLGA